MSDYLLNSVVIQLFCRPLLAFVWHAHTHTHAHTDAMYGTPWFGGNESAPTGSADEAAELMHAVRRLSAHPSIFAWNGTLLVLGLHSTLKPRSTKLAQPSIPI